MWGLAYLETRYTAFLPSPFQASRHLMFPHQKLDWHIKRIEERIENSPDDGSAWLELATTCLSRAFFHDGGEVWTNRALTAARRVLQHDPQHARALAIAGYALVGLHRDEQAARQLDEALRIDAELPVLRLALGALARSGGDRHRAVREYEMACRLAPDQWEPHYLLGRLLLEQADSLAKPTRLLERSQFHLVRSLALGASPALQPALLQSLGNATMRLGRYVEAQKLFTRLLDHPKYNVDARYRLGIIDYHLGKYKNAILHLRHYHRERPDHPGVHARIGMAYMQLGELTRAREACNRAIAIDPSNLQARWTLGCALLEEGHVDDAMRLFREILQDAPEHAQAFGEIVHLRRSEGDSAWLKKALRAEVTHYEHLPERARREAMGGQVYPRQATRDRIRRLARAMVDLAPSGATALLEAMDLTTDEGLRFMLWEEALGSMAMHRAEQLNASLQAPGRAYSAEGGRRILTVSSAIDPKAMTRGLQLEEEDLKRAAVDRHGPAQDVRAHRDNVEKERNEARAWQALLLVAIGARRAEDQRNLLVRWSTDADPELQLAASVGLALLGDEEAIERLKAAAAPRGAGDRVYRMADHLKPGPRSASTRPVSDDPRTVCDTCGRKSVEVEHIIVGAQSSQCDRCITAVARERRTREVNDPTDACSLCCQTRLEGPQIYRAENSFICASCIDHSLGLLEREEIDRFLSGL